MGTLCHVFGGLIAATTNTDEGTLSYNAVASFSWSI
ncbi:Uncharacterised protein [Yersinia intermedia]|nr:Uncharacterised protein [Yersinia intermedia]